MSGLLADAVFWIAVVSCVVAQIAITSAAARRRPARPADDQVPVPHRAAEVAWSLIPGVFLAMVLLLTWNAMRLADDRAALVRPPAEARMS